MDQLIITQEDWPHGLRCMDCEAELDEGTAYSKRLVGIAASGEPISEIVCVPCGLGLKSGR
jgi:hypothetical protein